MRAITTATQLLILFRMMYSCECFIPMWQRVENNNLQQSRMMRLFLAQQPEPVTDAIANNDDDTQMTLRAMQTIVGLTDTELKRIASRVPEIEKFNAQTSEVCIMSLMERLSLNKEEIKKKIVLRLPQVLGYEYSTDVEPNLSLLQQNLLLEDDELRSLILKCPQIIGLDYRKEIRPKVESVQRKLGFNNDGNLTNIKEEILRKPALLDVPVRGGFSSSRSRSRKT